MVGIIRNRISATIGEYLTDETDHRKEFPLKMKLIFKIFFSQAFYFSIVPLEIKKVADLHDLLCDLEKLVDGRISDVEVKKKKLEEKLIGLKFNMEDRKVVIMEAQESMAAIEQELVVISQ